MFFYQKTSIAVVVLPWALAFWVVWINLKVVYLERVLSPFIKWIFYFTIGLNYVFIFDGVCLCVVVDGDVSEFLFLGSITLCGLNIFSDREAGSLMVSIFYDFILAFKMYGIADLIRHDAILFIAVSIQYKSIFIEYDVWLFFAHP